MIPLFCFPPTSKSCWLMSILSQARHHHCHLYPKPSLSLAVAFCLVSLPSLLPHCNSLCTRRPKEPSQSIKQSTSLTCLEHSALSRQLELIPKFSLCPQGADTACPLLSSVLCDAPPLAITPGSAFLLRFPCLLIHSARKLQQDWALLTLLPLHHRADSSAWYSFGRCSIQ